MQAVHSLSTSTKTLALFLEQHHYDQATGALQLQAELQDFSSHLLDISKCPTSDVGLRRVGQIIIFIVLLFIVPPSS